MTTPSKNTTLPDQIWVVTGVSESSDHSGPSVFDHKPTEKELKKFITDTGEDLDVGGPGDFGSYLYLSVSVLKQSKSGRWDG